MSTKWTNEQQAVIDNRNSNLLISAAAGSGKTAVLIERILKLILDEKKPIDINKLLVVTFTKAAATEMKERLRTSIERELANNPENTHLQKQLLLLNRAEITTIDSFCGHILKNNFHLTDLSPSVKIGDPVEISILANEVMEDFFDELYANRDDRFLKLVNWYSNKNSDKNLIDLLLMINRFVNSSPFPNEWLKKSASFFDTSNKDEEFYIRNYCKEIAVDVKSNVISRIDRIKVNLEKIKDYFELEKYIKIFESSLEMFNEIVVKIDEFIKDSKLSSWETLIDYTRNILEIKFEVFRIPSKTDESIKTVYNDIKDSNKKYRDEILETLKTLLFDIDDIKAENEILYPYMKAIAEILMEFREKFLEKKKSMDILDFSDVTHYVLNLLTDYDEDGKKIPSKVALEYQEFFEEVFIDEYQDSNYVQESILSLVSRTEKPNRFMVGDVKQSIYRFRQAMPNIFMSKYDNYDDYTIENSKNKKIMLYNNFRSRREILEGCNLIFSKIMRKETGELDYTIEERLNPTAKFKEFFEDENIGGQVEIHITDELLEDIENSDDTEELKETKALKLECMNIANIIKKAVNNKENPFKVYDKEIDDYRNLEYRDIVILMRSPNRFATVFEEIFSNCGIPIYTDGSSGYFGTFEIDIIINLLKIIDNPIQDIELLSVMRSPIFKFNEEDFAFIRLVDRDKKIYDLLKIFEKENFDIKDTAEKLEVEEVEVENLKEKILSFLRKIEDFRKKSQLSNVDEFIWYLIHETGFYNYVGNLELGEQRQNNLLLLFERARNYEKTSYKGLFNFINYIERIKIRNTDLDEAKLISQDANVVKLMSIHKSKGLEFPVVILANCDKKFNFKSDDSNISLHQDLGFGPRVIDFENSLRFDSLYKNKIDKKQKKEQIAEEMRLLYVAMTRAKEKLIISARVKDFEKSRSNWENIVKYKGAVSDIDVLNSKNYLDWILYCVFPFVSDTYSVNICGEKCITKQIEDSLWSLNIYNRLEIFEKYNDNCKNILSEENKDKKIEFDFSFIEEKISNIENFSYKYSGSVKKPSSVSVSEIKKILLEENSNYENIFEEKNISLGIPKFLHNSKDVLFTNAEKGTILHLVMQLLDFKVFKNMETSNYKLEVKRQIEEFVKKDIISNEEAEVVNINWICRFLSSQIFKEILSALDENKLYREKAIYHSVKVNEIYKNESILDSERMMIVGIVDLFFETKNGIVLFDYKTDYVDDENFEEVVSRYSIQLELYKNALESISGKKVIKKYIYLMSIGKLVEY